MGKSLNQMIEAVADATTGEFERLKEFGIKSRQQGDRVTFTFRGVSTTVKKTASEIEEYLKRIGEVDFAGSMAEQMDTIDGKLSQLSDSWFQFTTEMGDSEKFKKYVGLAIGTPKQVLDSATLAMREAKLDLANATLADLAVIEQLIERNNAAISRAPKDGFATSYGAAQAIGEAERAKAQNELLRAKQEELQKEKEIKAAKEEAAALDERRALGAEKLADWEEKQRHKQRGILKTFASDHRKVMDQIYALQGKIREGAAGNVDAALKELDALQQQQEKLQESYAKAKEEQDQARAALNRYGNEWKTMRMNMREAFAEGIAGGKKLGDVLEDVLSIWARSMVMNSLLGKLDPATGARDGGLLDGIFGGSGGTGGILGGIGQVFSGGRTSGGQVTAGQLYRVNEGHGQIEGFRPHVGGQVVPLGGGSGGGDVIVNMNVDARGADSGVAANLMNKLPQIIKGYAMEAVMDARRRRAF
jgi:hypothetical protein